VACGQSEVGVLVEAVSVERQAFERLIGLFKLLPPILPPIESGAYTDLRPYFWSATQLSLRP